MLTPNRGPGYDQESSAHGSRWFLEYRFVILLRYPADHCRTQGVRGEKVVNRCRSRYQIGSSFSRDESEKRRAKS